GKPLKKGEETDKAVAELGNTDVTLPPVAATWNGSAPAAGAPAPIALTYKLGFEAATREAYGDALVKMGAASPAVVVTDGEVKNSTYADRFLKAYPDRFVEGYIAEQNMAGVALGLATEGKIVYASSFAAFLSRAYDFIRMAGF